MARCGKPRSKDYEYKRKGTVNAFCAIEPKRGRHFIKITKNRKADQFAEMLRDIGRAYPTASRIHLVMDNLSTHSEKSLVKNHGPKRSANLLARFNVHYTPKHGSRLNQVEIEISMFFRGCLGKDRIGTRVTLAKRAAAWERAMNEEWRKIDWRFTRARARLKFNYSHAKSPAGQD